MEAPHPPLARCVAVLGAWLCLFNVQPAAHAQNPRRNNNNAAEAPSTLHLDEGYIDLDTPELRVRLVKSSQTIAALQVKNSEDFDFTPADLLEKRAANGFHHLGDLTLRVRKGKTEAWREYDTAAARQPVKTLPASDKYLAASDLSPTLPPDSPVKITRSWTVEDGHLALRFDIANAADQPVEIGALGIPMPFNNIITNRNLDQAHAVCSFSDPYIGLDAGYLQVTRLSGQGPALVVVPLGKTPFEAYQPLDEPMARNQTFEGVLSWVVHGQAYAENEWRSATPWNAPTSATLAPGETRTYGVRFLLAPQIREIDHTLAANARPVAVGVPGYILPMDLDARLFLRYGHAVKELHTEPAGAIAVSREENPPSKDWQAYTLRGKIWGRARLEITYDDGLTQTIHYCVTKPAAQAVADLGHFLTTKQWFVDPADPFRRSPSAISYDRETNTQVTQDKRVWIAGLGDEAGSGSWLAAAMKLSGQPVREEVAKFEQFVDGVLWGNIQFSDGPKKWGVRKSAFYYQPDQLQGFNYSSAINWRGWESWNKKASEDIGRGYNYPHVVAAYWAMYRVARNHPGLAQRRPWQWYLTQAYETVNFMFSRNERGERNVGYVELGLMDGTVFLRVLEDLKHEGWTEQAQRVEALMRERADRWRGENYPFHSEMAWDSTGQEEVYDWCKYFGYNDKALVSLNSILGYMPTVPHWGYNGNARRYWDFVYGGKLTRIERQLHHYGSGLNAIPALAEYREHPEDFYLLRVGYGGAMGALSSIDEEGFASAAFHSFPSTLRWDAYSGDYGPNFFGHAVNAATYLVNHPEWGWQAFGGNVRREGDWMTVEPRDAFRQRVYVAPRGLWITLDAGQLRAVSLNAATGAVRVELDRADADTPLAWLRLEQPAKLAGVGKYQPPSGYEQRNEACEIPLRAETTTMVELAP